MKNIIVLGNWKANKTLAEAREWIKIFSNKLKDFSTNIILCPAFHHLSLFEEANLSISLGVQDVSEFDSGAYTGEISAQILAGLINYALLGHSERRKNFRETNEQIAAKVKQCLKFNIKPIVCISEIEEASALKNLVPKFKDHGLLLYEPLFAVGSGEADYPAHANELALQFRQVLEVPVLYGGSVTPDNVKSFVEQEFISGVGVGGASLDPVKFAELISRAVKS